MDSQEEEEYASMIVFDVEEVEQVLEEMSLTQELDQGAISGIRKQLQSIRDDEAGGKENGILELSDVCQNEDSNAYQKITSVPPRESTSHPIHDEAYADKNVDPSFVKAQLMKATCSKNNDNISDESDFEEQWLAEFAKSAAMNRSKMYSSSDESDDSEISNLRKEFQAKSASKKTRKVHKCSHCEKTFLFKEEVISHEVVHSDDRPYTCDECGIAFKRKNDLVGHQVVHLEEKPHQCKTCGARFTRVTWLTDHEKVHNREGAFKCGVCQAGFDRENDLMYHRNKVHPETKEERPFKCKQCTKQFKKKEHLTNHEAVHSGIKPFKCYHCGAEFYTKSNLTAHENIHIDSADRPFKCDHCGTGFTSMRYLTKHCNKNHIEILLNQLAAVSDSEDDNNEHDGLDNPDSQL